MTNFPISIAIISHLSAGHVAGVPSHEELLRRHGLGALGSHGDNDKCGTLCSPRIILQRHARRGGPAMGGGGGGAGACGAHNHHCDTVLMFGNPESIAHHLIAVHTCQFHSLFHHVCLFVVCCAAVGSANG